MKRTVALVPKSRPDTSCVGSFAIMLAGSETIAQPAGSVSSPGVRGTKEARSDSVTAGVAGIAGATRVDAGGGQYHGRGTIIAQIRAVTLELHDGGGTTIIEPPGVRVPGFATAPGLVLDRTRLTPPPVIEPEVQSSTGPWHTAAAGETDTRGENCAAMIAETTSTAAQSEAPARNRRGRSGFRAGAMGTKLRSGEERASGIIHNRDKTGLWRDVEN